MGEPEAENEPKLAENCVKLVCCEFCGLRSIRVVG